MRAKKLIIGGITVAALAIGIPVASAATDLTVGKMTASNQTRVCQYLVTQDAPIAVWNPATQAFTMATAYKGSIANISFEFSKNGATASGGNFYTKILTGPPQGPKTTTYQRYATSAFIVKTNLQSRDRCWLQ